MSQRWLQYPKEGQSPIYTVDCKSEDVICCRFTLCEIHLAPPRRHDHSVQSSEEEKLETEMGISITGCRNYVLSPKGSAGRCHTGTMEIANIIQSKCKLPSSTLGNIKCIHFPLTCLKSLNGGIYWLFKLLFIYQECFHDLLRIGRMCCVHEENR